MTKAWADEFLTGYRLSAADALAERFTLSKPSERELVVVTNLHFRSMCPHHLMPYSGTAHLAYLPGEERGGLRAALARCWTCSRTASCCRRSWRATWPTR